MPRKPSQQIIQVKATRLPEKWDYDESVKRMRPEVAKWKTMTVEVLQELWTAREILQTARGRGPLPQFRDKCPKTWENYCCDIGLEKRTVNRWLAAFETADHSLVGKMTGNAENYTPKEYLDAVREVLGGIDLDPASCDRAQELVKAKRYYTAEDSGLNHPWYGRVFLNPPYGMPEIRLFTNKLLAELPHLEAGILLTNDQTDTDWWQGCARKSALICFAGRIGFYTPTVEKTSPTNGQSFMYFGPHADHFNERFAEMGPIVKVIQ